MATMTVIKPGTSGSLNGSAEIVAGLSNTGNTPSAAGTTDVFLNDGRTAVLLECGGTSAGTYRFFKKKANSEGLTHDRVITLSANARIWIGPFLKDDFDNQSGQVECRLDSGGTIGGLKVHCVSLAG